MSRPAGYFDRMPSITSEGQMQALLAERTRKVNGSGVAQSVAEHGVDKSRLPGADPAAVAALQWLAPVKDSLTGHYTVKDLTKTYTVVAERRSGGEGWQYLAFKGSTVLAPVYASAECAKAHCLADAEKNCSTEESK